MCGDKRLGISVGYFLQQQKERRLPRRPNGTPGSVGLIAKAHLDYIDTRHVHEQTCENAVIFSIRTINKNTIIFEGQNLPWVKLG